MKNLIRMVVASVVVVAASSAWAALDFSGSGGSFSVSASPGATISDYGTGIPGPAYRLNFNSAGYTDITGISVTFTTTGGWNGDLYAYLSHDGGGFAVLVNRVGANATGDAGYGTSGFPTITLGMGGTDIHTVESPSGSGFSADGRLDYTSSTRDNTLNVFNHANPNGGWTISFQDMAGGDVATLGGFTVSITAVPEPINVALGVFGGVFAAGAVGLRLRTRAQAKRRSDGHGTWRKRGGFWF